jgi:hypothetical protein
MSAFEPEETVQNRARMEALINSAFKREVIRKVTDVILPLNDVGFGPSFYCVHSIGGGATEFQHMARMLGPKQNFYGIQVPTQAVSKLRLRTFVQKYFLNYDELETNNSASRYRKKKTKKTILLILRSRTFSHSLDQQAQR